MIRKLASVQRIIDIQPIPGADAIEVATVLGWHCVIAKKDNFTVGSLVIYCEVDSLLPVKPEFEFLARGSSPKKTLVDGKEVQGYRIKTIKLRGQISQGIVLPITILGTQFPYALMQEGDDVTDVLGIHKYEIPVPAQLAGKVRGGFPGFLPKTDEPRLQAFPQLLDKYTDIPFYVTEKIDGSSCTFVIKHEEFHVCSRNLDLLEDSSNSLWKLAREMQIQEKLQKLNELAKEEKYAFQGEIYGEGIQGNPLKVKGQKIAFYNIYDFVKGEYISHDDTVVLAQGVSLPLVPNLYDPKDNDVSWRLRPTVDEMVELSKIKSTINPNVLLEGMVWRPLIEEMQDPDIGRLSFKVINPEYLLKHE